MTQLESTRLIGSDTVSDHSTPQTTQPCISHQWAVNERKIRDRLLCVPRLPSSELALNSQPSLAEGTINFKYLFILINPIHGWVVGAVEWFDAEVELLAMKLIGKVRCNW
jgi:hypothetical protein